MYPKGSKEGPGWVQTPADVDRAVDAWRNGTLPTERFASITKDGKRYTVTNGTRLGLVPHRNGIVARFCLDFDDHKGDGGNVHLVKAIERFLGAESIKFTSKGGKGLHCLYALDQPLPVEQFVEWAKAWGFNRRGDIECFPKTVKRSQVWLPNEPNENGGDAYRSGTLESCVIKELPPAPSRRLNKETLDFLRGFVAPGYRNDALNRAAYHCAKQRMAEGEAGKLCARGARLCGLLNDEPDKSKTTFENGYRAGSEEVRTRQPKPTDDRTAGPEKLRALGCTDYGNAQRLVRRHGQDLMAEREQLDQQIAAADKVLAEAEQTHTDATTPLVARIAELREACWAAESAKAELIRTCSEPQFVAQMAGVESQLTHWRGNEASLRAAIDDYCDRAKTEHARADQAKRMVHGDEQVKNHLENAKRHERFVDGCEHELAKARKEIAKLERQQATIREQMLVP